MLTLSSYNIPISISLLHEQEYNNIYLLMKPLKKNTKSRRAFSERKEINHDSNNTTDNRRITLKK
jgi:hypothetical protein